ncbi:MAG: lysostaphin resistance A-like protein [Nocardioidaceae bacterium]
MTPVDGSDAPARPRWGLGDAIPGFAVLMLGAFGGGDSGDTELSPVALMVGEVFLAIFLAGIPLWALHRKGRGAPTEIGLRARLGDVPRYLALGVAVQAIAVPLLYLPLLQFSDYTNDDVSDRAEELTDAAAGFGIVWLVLAVVVIAPVIEEVFFRGLVLRALERRFGTGWALTGSTVLFTVTHFQVIEAPALALVGATAGWLAIRHGRLGPSIFLHAGFNGWTVVALLALE